MASIKKTSKYWWLNYYNNGKREYINLFTTDKKIATQKLKEFEAAQTLKLTNSSKYKLIPSFVKFSEAYADFKTSKLLAPNTLRIYKNAANSFIKSRGDHPLIRYSNSDFYQWVQNLRDKKKSQNTIAIYSRHLHAIWNWFIKNKLIESNIIDRVPGEKKTVKIIPDADLQIIYAALTPDQVNTIKWLLHTGMRVGESVLLKTSQIDLKNNIIYLRNVKGKRNETLPIIAPVRALLETMDLKQEFLLKHRSYNAVRLFFERAIDALTATVDKRGKKITPKLKTRYSLHQLRKTCGSMLANSGVDPVFLKTYLRHTDIKTTLDYYTLIDNKKMQKEIDKKVDWQIKKQPVEEPLPPYSNI